MNNRQLDCQNEKGKTMKRGEKMGTARVSCAKALVALLVAAAAFAAEAVTVNSVAALQGEIASATVGKEIVIAAGTYNLADETAMNAEGHLYVAIKKITLRGATGNPADVVLVGSDNRILFMANGTSGCSISGITFKNGYRSSGRGGAINFRGSNDETTVSNCVFVGNKAVDGGAVADYYTYNAAGSNRGGIFVDCLFTNNTATGTGGAGYNISLFQRCTFLDNKAATYGATVSASLSACTNRYNVATGNYSECNVTYAQDCLFEEMESSFAAFTSCGFNRCRFRNATSGSLFATQLHMTNSIVENCSPAEGKYVYLVYNMSGMEMINCNVVSNAFRYFKQGGSNVRNGHVVNSLFYGNKYGNAVVDMDANVTSCVAGFTNCVYAVAPANEAEYAPGENNFNYHGQDFNPGFVGAEKDPDNPYALSLKSPLTTTYHGLVMDWMADATDIRGAGYPRLREGKVDIGCYQCWLKPRGTYLTFQ